MLGILVEKLKGLNNKEKLILSIVGILIDVLVGISISVLLKNIVSLFIILGTVYNFGFLFDKYSDYKKKYCYELVDESFNKIKDNIDENKVKVALKKMVKNNKIWNSIFIGSIPLAFLLTIMLFCFDVGLLNVLTCTGIIYFGSVIITVPYMSKTAFGIDVLCELIEKIENSKKSTELAKINQNSVTFKEKLDKLTYNKGISKYRYKYVPDAIKYDYMEVIVPITEDKQKVIKVRERTKLK